MSGAATAPDPPAVRPHRLVLVTGTSTEVGKTWTASRMLEKWRSEGIGCSARKPAQSFTSGDRTTDGDELAAATGEAPDTVCPSLRCYEVPMAPPMAADALGRPRIAVADLVAEVSRSWTTGPGATPPEIGLVELAGGVRSPQAHDGDALDMIDALAPDAVVLVADAGLGTVNAVVTALDAFGCGPTSAAARPRPTVHLNRYDDGVEVHRRNLAWLTDVLPSPPTTDVGALAELASGTVRERCS